MNAYVCPKGHTSAEPDYCSECGAKIGNGSHASAPIAPPPPASDEQCPDCGTARDASGAIFCDVCGYNFATGAHGELGVAAPPPPTPQTEPTPEPAPQPTPQLKPPPAPSSWTLTLSVDPTLREPGSPEPPIGVGPFTLRLAGPVSLIGRRSTARGIFPEIPLSHDDAVSHRHALLQLDASGALSLRDIGAANGTRLNGQDIKPLTDYPLKDGDEITLGHWSRLSIKAAP
jgi:hypothetical protein